MKSQYPNTKLYIAQKKRKKQLTESNPHKSRTQVVTAEFLNGAQLAGTISKQGQTLVLNI